MSEPIEPEVFHRTRALIQQWADAYNVEFFGPKQINGYEEACRVNEHLKKIGPYSLDNINASMGRHMAWCLLRELDALQAEMQEEISEKQG
jgi:hypothetical protein